MRTCIVSGLYPIRSAIPDYTEGLIDGLASTLDPEQIFVIANKNLRPSPRKKKVRIFPTWEEGPRFVLQVFRKTIRLRPTVVHLQHEFSLYGGPASAALFPLLLLLLRFARVKTVVTLHGVLTPSIIDDNFRRDFYANLRTPILKIGIFTVTFLSAHLADRVIVHSEWQRDLLRQNYGVKSTSVVVIRHGTQIFPKVSAKTSQAHVKGIFFGYITPNKGLDTLIQAFKKVNSPDLVLEIVGGRHRRDVSYYEKIQTECEREIDPHRITYTGYLPSSEVHDILADADFAIFPYTSAISVSGALCMAIGHGLPIIASRTRAFFEYLDPERNCMMITPGDSDALRESLERLANDADYRAKLATEMKKFSSGISWERIGQLTVETYEGIANDN